MKQEIVKVFDNVTMPTSCEENIRRALESKNRAAGFCINRMHSSLAAFALLLAAMLAFSPQVRAAVSDWMVRYVFPESGITIYEAADEEGNVTHVMAVDTEQPAFASYRDGRLYFTGNGENRDITGEISPEAPYIYSYTDAYGLTHYMAVGYTESMENFGIYEFLREEAPDQQPWEGWSNGYGRNFLDEAGKRYPWVDILWEQLDLPWPLPGE